MTDVAGFNINALILDMDGVLWRADQPIGNLPAIFDLIEQKGMRFTLATNNSTRTVGMYQEKLRKFGVDVQAHQVITSTVATASYLKSKYPNGGAVHIIGEEGLINTLNEAGFKHTDSDVLAVVVGLDTTISYEKLRRATLLIRHGAPFIGTNPDKTYPTPEGQAPGAGSLLAALQASTGISPLIIGKPKPEMFTQAMISMGTSPTETLVVGDRLETDILGGQNANCRTAIVLSGVTAEHEALAWNPAADIIVADLAELIDSLP